MSDNKHEKDLEGEGRAGMGSPFQLLPGGRKQTVTP